VDVLQHFEDRPDGPLVNASELCGALQRPHGPFERCAVAAAPYGSGAQHLATARGLPFMATNGTCFKRQIAPLRPQHVCVGVCVYFLLLPQLRCFLLL
jgi:hypothetical protein